MLCWSLGEGETGKGGDDEAESGYPGADVVELVNLRGDTTTVYKLADGTYAGVRFFEIISVKR